MKIHEMEVNNLSFGFKGKDLLFQNIDFKLKSGDALAVLGPNGAGKTTFLKCLLRLNELSSGNVFLDGKNVHDMGMREYFEYIAYVPQMKRHITSYTVFETVLMGRTGQMGVFSKPGKEDTEAAERAIQYLGIEKLKNMPCDRISGGELQLVYIARAISKKPHILILDEPESALDFKNRLVCMENIRMLSKTGMICIFNTHFPESAFTYSDKILYLGKGDAVFGETKELLNEENIRRFFRVDTKIIETTVNGKTYKTVIPTGTVGAKGD